MTFLGRSVAYGWGLKVAFYDGRFPLSAAQVRPNVVDHVLKCRRPFSANGVGFHILVEHLIGIEVRAVGGQEDESELGRVFVDPLLCFPGAMDRMSIHNQEDFSIRLPLETAHEVNKHVRVELAFEHAEAKLASVSDGRHHGAARALTAARDHGGVPFHTVAASALIVHANAHFVCPPQRGILLLGLLTDLWIFCLQPTRHRVRVALIGTRQRLLRGHTPALQIPTHRPDRYLHTDAIRNQLLDRFSGPQCERQLDSAIYRLPASSFADIEIFNGRRRNTVKGLLIGWAIGSVVVAVVHKEVHDPGYYDPDVEFARREERRRAGRAGLIAVLISTAIGYNIKTDRWIDVPLKDLNLSVVPSQNNGMGAAVSLNF